MNAMIPLVPFSSDEQRNMAGTWLHPPTQNYVHHVLNRSHLGYIGRIKWATWEHSQSYPNLTWREHTWTHGLFARTTCLEM
jgi:hypothetical protein